jgi:hypothetical protein
MRGEERFSAPGKSWTLIVRFSAGYSKTPGLKPILEVERYSAELKFSFPLLKQGAPTKRGRRTFSATAEEAAEKVGKRDPSPTKVGSG